MTTVSIIIPTYNEAATIISVLEQVAAQKIKGISFEVVVVDDGSADNSKEVIEARPDLYAQFIVMPQNGGKGAAVKAGLAKATGDYILFQDADTEYDPADYKTLMLPVTKFQADLVMGSRILAPQYVRVAYFWHAVGNRVITLFFNLLFNTTYTDIYSCYLMYRRELVNPDDLKSVGWEQHAEILATASTKAKVMYEAPISYHGRSYEEGKKIRWYHVIPVLTMIAKKRLFG